jgi:hypothetical protein
MIATMSSRWCGACGRSVIETDPNGHTCSTSRPSVQIVMVHTCPFCATTVVNSYEQQHWCQGKFKQWEKEH